MLLLRVLRYRAMRKLSDIRWFAKDDCGELLGNWGRCWHKSCSYSVDTLFVNQYMPTRTLTFRDCVYGVMLVCSSQVQADGSSWNGSYAANGGCYCIGEQSRYIDSKIVPTPVGGQSIAQVCDRVGDGPMLQKVNGKFNYTVYPDAQCGNGPFSDAKTNQNKECIGHLGINGEDCATNGPRWDLIHAYSRQIEKSTVNGIDSKVTGGSRHIEPPIKKMPEANDEISEASTISVAEIARARANSEPILTRKPKIVEPQTREQIRARQLVHMAEARERAKLAKSAQLNLVSESGAGLSSDTTAVPAKPEQIKPSQTAASKKASVDSVTEIAKIPAVTKETPTALTALKLPVQPSHSDPDFNYIEAAPVNYDFGGAGMSIAASKTNNNRMQYVLKVAAANAYQEAAIGVGMFFKPSKASRTTLMVRAGLEYGSMEFDNGTVKTTHADSGVFATVATRVAFTSQFVLQAGVGYSSFFEGDVIGFGAAFYHITRKLDLTAKAEIGDNDLLGFGIRYHY